MRLTIAVSFSRFLPCSAETMPPKRDEHSVISQRALEEHRGRQSMSRSTIPYNAAVEGQTYSPVVNREVPVMSSKPPVSTFSTTPIQKGERIHVIFT